MLVTGGAGFIGSNLCEDLLANGNEVVCLDNLSTGNYQNVDTFCKHKDFKLFEGDVRVPSDCRKAVDGVDYVLHQAALGSVPRSINNPIETNQVNVDGFLNMLIAARDANVKRFVYATSSSVYGSEQRLPKVEAKIGKPLSPYAVTKLVNEHYAGVFADLFGMETVGLRYFNVFGPNQDPNGAYAAAIPKFIQLFIRHKPPLLHGDGTQSRDFTYVKNVVHANHIAALTTNPAAINQVYNIACGVSTNLIELCELLRNLLSGYDPAIAEIDVEHGEERQGDVRHSLASIVKAQTMLGYKPKYGISEGMKEAIDWYWQKLSS